MNTQAILDAIGLGDLAAADILSVQLLILAATVVLFFISLAAMFVALRSAGGARLARADAEAHLRSAQDFAVEARQLSAQAGRAAHGKSGADAPAPIRVSARETTPEAEIEIMELKSSDAVSNRNLDAAKESVTVPKGLMRRRRRF